MAKIDLNEADKQLGYLAKRGGLYMAGKFATHEVAPALGENIARPIGEAANSILASDVLPLGGLANGLGGPVGVMTIGMIAALSAGLTQMDYNRKVTQLKDSIYTEELSAKLKKPAHTLTNADLYDAAKENRTLDEQIHKIKRQRNFGVFFSFAASLMSMAVVKLALPTVLAFAGVPEHAAALSLAWCAEKAILSGMGLTAYHLLKTPLHWLGDKLFGLDKETAHDRILALVRDRGAGKEITSEQVLSVFAAANPRIKEFVAARYGAEFDTLAAEGKQRAAEELGALVPLEQLARDINAGKINPMELAFAAQGEFSGVDHDRGTFAKPPGPLGAVWTKVRHVLHFKGHPRIEVVAAGVENPEILAAVYQESASARSFAERLGRPKMDTAMGYVERLDKSRGEPIPTIIHT